MFPPKRGTDSHPLHPRGYKFITPMKSDPVWVAQVMGSALQSYEMLPRSFCSKALGSAVPLREPPGDKVPFLVAWGLSSSSAMAPGSWGGEGCRNSALEWGGDPLRAQIPQGYLQGWLCPPCPPPETCHQQKGDGTQEGMAGSAARHGPGTAMGGRMGNGNGDTGL